MCASGGVMIACSADKILSAPVGIIGSVGVMMGPNFNVASLMEKYGVKQLTLTEGKDKDLLSPFRPWKEGEGKSLRNLIAYDYDLFVNLVVKSRPRIDRSLLINEYGAHVYNPVEAEKFGFIDAGQSSYNAALTELVSSAGIKEGEEYQVVELKLVHPVLSGLMEGKSPLVSGRIKHEMILGPEFHPELMNRPLYLYSPALQMFSSDNTG